MSSKLANKEIAKIFTISKDTWSSIDEIAQWVITTGEGQSLSGGYLLPENSKIHKVHGPEGSVLQNQLNGVSKLNPPSLSLDYLAFIVEYYVTNVKPVGYNFFTIYSKTKVIKHSKDWSQAKDILTSTANLVSAYAGAAQQSFADLKQIADNSSKITPIEAELIKDTLSAFQGSTDALIKSAKTNLSIVTDSVNSINSFATFLQNNSFLIPIIGASSLTLNLVNEVTTGIELVLGTYQTLINNLSELTKPGIDINNEFVAGLEIDNAMSDWNKIEIEATAFTSNAAIVH